MGSNRGKSNIAIAKLEKMNYLCTKNYYTIKQTTFSLMIVKTNILEFYGK
jgi:hypothetical protein